MKKVNVTVWGELVSHVALVVHSRMLELPILNQVVGHCGKRTPDSSQRPRTATSPSCDLGILSKLYLLSLLCKTKRLCLMA